VSREFIDTARLSWLNSNVRDETPVLATFLEPAPIDLRERGIDEHQTAELRARLATFAEDWDSPEMSIYDDYYTAKAKQQKRQ
jgi:hypothetical protein